MVEVVLIGSFPEHPPAGTLFRERNASDAKGLLHAPKSTPQCVWGRIGSAGRLVSSRFASEQEAALAMAGHLAKLRKGYEAV